MAESNQVVYTSRVRVKRKSGPMRLACLPAEKEPVIFGSVAFPSSADPVLWHAWINIWRNVVMLSHLGIMLEEIIHDVDQVLVMTVNSG